MSDAPDWTVPLTIVDGATLPGADFPDWTAAAFLEGGGAGGYASLTGPGETVTPGDLTQAGGLTVDGDLTVAGLSVSIAQTGASPARLEVHDESSTGAGAALVSDTGPVAVESGAGLFLVDGSTTGVHMSTSGVAADIDLDTVDADIKIRPGGVDRQIRLDTSGTGGVSGGIRIGVSPGEKIGFYGNAVVPQPSITGSRAGNAALTNLLDALSNLGLILDNTTP